MGEELLYGHAGFTRQGSYGGLAGPECEHHSEQIALLENDPGNQAWWNMAAI